MDKIDKIRYSTLSKPYFKDKSDITFAAFKNICYRHFKARGEESGDKKTNLVFDRQKKANLGRVDDIKINDRYVENGYIELNTFCDFKRDDVLMNYNTLYKRIFNDERIAHYLNDNGFIYVYYKRKKNSSEYSLKRTVIVNRRKEEEFIKLIFEHFMTDDQQKMKLLTKFKSKDSVK